MMTQLALSELPQAEEEVRIPWGPIGEQVYRRTYSREKPDGTRETWPETVQRAVDGNLGLVDPSLVEPDEREKLLQLLLTFGMIPAGRHLYASGVQGRQFLFNCHASGWDPKEPWLHFTFLFDQLMQGGGVGSNYSNRYMETLPVVCNPLNVHVWCSKEHPNVEEFAHLLSNTVNECYYINVDDSREGWVTAIEILLRHAYTMRHNLPIVVDVSAIRQKGLPLKTSGGISCGPGPLVSMILDFVRRLNTCVGRKLSSLDAMALDHILAACVVAGGKRRSSRMSIKNWLDEDVFEFINCKAKDGDHWTTNVSVETDTSFEQAWKGGDEWALQLMRAVTEGKQRNGEPGIWNRSLSQKDELHPELMFCPNPCGEIGLQEWENCNLGHINLQYFAGKSPKKIKEAFRLMTRWLIRATYGDIPQARQRQVVDRNRRIGVGFFGFHGWLALNGVRYSQCWRSEFVRTSLAEFASVVSEEATEYSKVLGIPRPVKTTTVAPTGTIACLPGVSTGLQAIFAPWYKRLVRYSDTDPELAIKKLENYPVYPDNDARNTEIVEYWCEDPLVSIVNSRGFDAEDLLEAQDEIAFEDCLEVQAMVQDIYADNAISYTINIPVDQMPDPDLVSDKIMALHHRLKGTTMFPDRSRKNSPLQRVTREQFETYTGPKEVQQIEDQCKGGCPIR